MGIAKTYRGVDNFISNLGPEVCLDFETNTTDVYHPDFAVTGVAMYDGENSMYIPVMVAKEGINTRNSIKPDMWSATKFLDKWQAPVRKMLTQTGVLIAHNLSFELSILYKHGLYPLQELITTERDNELMVLDTMGMAHLFNEAIPLSLKKLSYIILDRDQDEFDWSHFTSVETAAHYATQDVVNDFDLCQWLWGYLDKNHLLGLYMKQFYKLPILVENMERHGLNLNLELMGHDKKFLLDRASRISADLCGRIGPIEVTRVAKGEKVKEEIPFSNPNSTVELRAALAQLGMKWRKSWVTPKGLPSTSRSILKEAAANHAGKPVGDFLEQVLEYRKLVKYAQFIDTVMRQAHFGIVRPGWNPYGTTSDRWSCSGPNLQNQPKSMMIDDYEINPRNWFIAPPGWSMVVADLSQAELRVLAGRSGDQGMIEGYASGVDGHTNTAALIYGKKPEDVTDKERFIGKTSNFAIVYGSGPATMAKVSGISVEEAKQIRAKLQQAMPDAVRWIQEQHRAVQYWGETEIEGGRFRRPVYAKAAELLPLDPEELTPGVERAEWYALENELKKDQKRRLSMKVLRGMTNKERKKTLNELNYRAKLQGANAAIQGQVALHLDLALIKLFDNDAKLAYNVVGQIHDEVIVVCPTQVVEEVKAWVVECLESSIGEVALTADADIGKSWGDAK